MLYTVDIAPIPGKGWANIHGDRHKLTSGSVAQGINAIDSFTFSVLPNNPAFGELRDLVTMVRVINEKKGRYEFIGRVLNATPSMSETGALKQDVTCESLLGYLCDSETAINDGDETTISYRDLIRGLVNRHNEQLADEPWKQFTLGDTAWLGSRGVTEKFGRDKTWNHLKKHLLDPGICELGLTITEDGKTRLDFVEKLGAESRTAIAVSRNMKTVTQECDPSSIITRLTPLGAKLHDGTEERHGIESANGGLAYIEDDEARQKYGIICGSVEFDELESATEIKAAGVAWLTDNNKVKVKYVVTALDLSLIGLDVDDFQRGNTHPLKNALLGIDDSGRITKKTIDICDPTKTSFEIGEAFRTLSQLQKAQTDALGKINAEVAIIKRDYVTNEALTREFDTVTSSIITQVEDEVLLSVSAGYVDKGTFDNYTAATTAELSLKVGTNAAGELTSMLKAKANMISIESDYFTLTADGHITATGGTIGGFTIGANYIAKGKRAFSDAIAGVYLGTDGIGLSAGDYAFWAADGKVTLTSDLTAGGTQVIDLDGLGLRMHVDGTSWTTEALRLEQSGTYREGTALTPIYRLTSKHLRLSATDGKMEGTWTSESEITVTSDREAKHDIESLPDGYGSIFDALRPVRFKYNDGTSDRYHTGFIAQEVAEAAEGAGVGLDSFAAVCRANPGTEDERWGIRYGELIALCVQQIQQTKARVSALEERTATI